MYLGKIRHVRDNIFIINAKNNQQSTHPQEKDSTEKLLAYRLVLVNKNDHQPTSVAIGFFKIIQESSSTIVFASNIPSPHSCSHFYMQCADHCLHLRILRVQRLQHRSHHWHIIIGRIKLYIPNIVIHNCKLQP